MSKLYTANELAEVLGVNPQTIYRWGQRGLLKTLRVGRSVRFEKPGEDKTDGVKDWTESESEHQTNRDGRIFRDEV